ncbi:MAG: hypothetical protein FVQ81_02265 [Candidatus Glassbacteria bacterium]|nr:hypothetical protein [Candidatus Glassbacteria bacterium]
MQILFKMLIIYLVYKVVTILLRKGVSFYRAFKSVQNRKRAEHAVRRGQDYNIRAFDIEDAKFEEIKPGKDD